MIKILHQNSPKVDKKLAIRSLDSLVESLCESYAIPSSLIPEMKSGLEDSLTDYLVNFIDSHSISKLTESSKSIDISANPSVEYILESIRLNTEVRLILGNSELVRFTNYPSGIIYEFTEFDPSNLNSDILIESWRSDDASQLAPMIDELLKSRKE